MCTCFLPSIISLTVFVVLLIILAVRLFAKKGRCSVDSILLSVPCVAAIAILVYGLIADQDLILLSVSVSFALFALYSCARVPIVWKAIVTFFGLSTMFLSPHFAALIVLADSVLLVWYRFSDAKHLVRKQALSMLIQDTTVWIMITSSLLILHLNAVTMESIPVRYVLDALAVLLFSFAFIRFAWNKIIYLPDSQVHLIENLSIKYVRNDIAVNADDSAAELYERILQIMENERLYLNPDMTVVKLASAVFSNKTYVGRVILRYSGKNYCTFMNGYRLEYAKKKFEEDPFLRVGQLSELSGFKNVSSFNLAFNIQYGMSPKEWCILRRQHLKK